MSLVEELHAARKARLARMNGKIKEAPAPKPDDMPAFRLRPIWFSIEDGETQPDLFIKNINRTVCRYFDITGAQLRSQRRTIETVYARQIAMLLARRYSTKSTPEIGRRLGGRDHTTVLHGVRKIENACRTDWEVAYDVAHIEATL